jgi:hypothetical protein
MTLILYSDVKISQNPLLKSGTKYAFRPRGRRNFFRFVFLFFGQFHFGRRGSPIAPLVLVTLIFRRPHASLLSFVLTDDLVYFFRADQFEWVCDWLGRMRLTKTLDSLLEEGEDILAVAATEVDMAALGLDTQQQLEVHFRVRCSENEPLHFCAFCQRKIPYFV